MIEDERKYLVNEKAWEHFLDQHPEVFYRTFLQYYLHVDDNMEVRLRHIPDDCDCDGPQNILTIKFGGTEQKRVEINQRLRQEEARIVSRSPVAELIKRRYEIAEGVIVDEFVKPDIVSLCEFENTDLPAEEFPFLGKEVTGYPQYYNQNIAVKVGG